MYCNLSFGQKGECVIEDFVSSYSLEDVSIILSIIKERIICVYTFGSNLESYREEGLKRERISDIS